MRHCEALAVIKGLAGQVEGLVGKFPPVLFMVRNAPEEVGMAVAANARRHAW